MLEFLIGLLLFVFGLGSVDHPALDPQTIADRIEEHISEVLPPQGDPESSYQGSQEIADNDTEVPEEEQENNQEPQGEDDSQGNDGNEENQNEDTDNFQLSENPDTTQVSAYNTSSGIVIENVATVAVNNAPPLVSCIDNPDCDQPAPQDEPPPTPTPTPIFVPDPIPCPLPIFPDNPRILAPQLICVE